MEDTQNASIPVWMCITFSFWRKNHNVAVCAGVHGILAAPDIIGCVIYSENLGSVHPVVDNLDGISLLF
jgi:hypothetical protein